MPKPMLRPNQGQKSSELLSAVRPESRQKNDQAQQMQLDRLMRKPRSKKYMEAMHKLDAGGHVHNQQQVNDIIDAIRSEFPEVAIQGVLLGIVAVCYLGRPYEVHTIDLVGSIIEHYKRGEPMPGQLEKARSLAMMGGYDFIEVYVDCCRCISSTGAVSVVKN